VGACGAAEHPAVCVQRLLTKPALPSPVWVWYQAAWEAMNGNDWPGFQYPTRSLCAFGWARSTAAVTRSGAGTMQAAAVVAVHAPT